MKYLITSIKDVEDIITPSPVINEIDDLFNPFPFPKFEEQLRSCMMFYRIETFGTDHEKFPITFENFNPKYDNFRELNYNRLNKIIEHKEFKIDLKQYFSRHEDFFVRDITEQLPNPSEAEFKMFLYNSLKNLQSSYEFLFSSHINNNLILNLVKYELIESYKRAFEKSKSLFPIYDEIFKKFKFETNLSNADSVNNKDSLVYILSREEILTKLIDGTNNRRRFEIYEEKLIKKQFLSKDLDEWKNSSVNFVRFYTFCEREKIFKTHYLKNSKGIKLLRKLYGFEDANSLNYPSKREKITSAKISSEYYFLK